MQERHRIINTYAAHVNTFRHEIDSVANLQNILQHSPSHKSPVRFCIFKTSVQSPLCRCQQDQRARLMSHSSPVAHPSATLPAPQLDCGLL